MGSIDCSDVTIHFGKFSGATLAEIWKEEPDYVFWLRDNIENDWLRSRVRSFIESVAKDRARRTGGKK